MSHVTFPGLGLEFDINRVAFSIGGFDVYWYGVLIALGMFIGVILGQKNARRFGIDPDKLYDIIIFGAFGALLGGRSFYVIFADDYKVTSIKQFFNLREGGTAFYGILSGALITAFIVSRINKTKFLCLLDDLALGFLVGQGLGRWGNFFNQELFGTNTDLPWRMYSDTIAKYISRNAAALYENHGIVLTDGPVHPTFLYESIWCFIGVIVLSRMIDKRKFDGEIGLMYLVWNGIGRAFCESLRTDALFWGPVRISQAVCITYATVAFIAIVVIRRKIKTSDDPSKYTPYAMTEQYLRDIGELPQEEVSDTQPSDTEAESGEPDAEAGPENFLEPDGEAPDTGAELDAEVDSSEEMPSDDDPSEEDGGEEDTDRETAED